MFTAYQVHVAIRMQDNVTHTLGMMAKQLGLTGTQAKLLQARLNSIKLSAGLGIASFGAAFVGLEIIKSVVKPAMEYAHQLNVMNNLGMTQKDIAESVAAAWKNTGTVITTTAVGNLRTIVDLRNMLADKEQMKIAGRDATIDMSMAYAMLPTLTKLQAVLTASTIPGTAAIGKADSFIYDMAKTLDIRGAATDPKRFAREADLMAKAMMGMQGRITPQNFMQAVIYARQEKFELSDKFMYERGLPTLLLEQGGGGQKGIGPMLAALNRWFVQNIHTPGATYEAEKLGLIDHWERQGKKKVGVMKGADLALTDPYALATELILPSVLKKFPGINEAGITKEVGKLFQGNMLLGDVMLRFIHQQANFIRDQQVIKGVLPTDTAYQQSLMRDPTIAFAALSSQWENLKTAFGVSVIPILIPTIMTLAQGLQAFTAYARESPGVVKALTFAFTALTVALGFSGVVWTLRAAFMGLNTVMGLAGLTGAANGMVGALGLVLKVALKIAAIATVYEGLKWSSDAIADKIAGPGTAKGLHDRYEEPGGGLARIMPGADPNKAPDPNATASIIAEAIRRSLFGFNIILDAKKIGQWIDDRFSKENSRPPVDGAGVNNRISPIYPGTSE